MGEMEDIPVAEVFDLPYEHGKPFIIEQEIGLHMQMFKFHKWYDLRMTLFGVKYRDQDFFHGQSDFWVDFELVHAIYPRDTLDLSILTIWVM